MARSLTEMAAEIVKAQAAVGRMAPEEIEASLIKTFEALQGISGRERGEVEEPAEKTELELLREEPLKSIQTTKVINLEDGSEYKVLTNRTLAKFGMSTREYKKKWGIPLKTPLSAKGLTARRKKWAKERDLGQLLKEARAKKAK